MDPITYKGAHATITIHLERLTEFVPPKHIPKHDETNLCVASCLKRLRRWPAPWNWSEADWRAEMFQIALLAACEATGDFDPERGSPFAKFLEGRIMSRTLAHHRREWRYGERFPPETQHGEVEKENEEVTNNSGAMGLVAINTEEDPRWFILLEALASLSNEQRRLIAHLFWDEITEEEAGRMFGVTRRGINKRKQPILELLRKHFQVEVQAVNSRKAID